MPGAFQASNAQISCPTADASLTRLQLPNFAHSGILALAGFSSGSAVPVCSLVHRHALLIAPPWSLFSPRPTCEFVAALPLQSCRSWRTADWASRRPDLRQPGGCDAGAACSFDARSGGFFLLPAARSSLLTSRVRVEHEALMASAVQFSESIVRSATSRAETPAFGELRYFPRQPDCPKDQKALASETR